MELRRAAKKDTDTIWQMQNEAFAELLARYQDYDTSPANEEVKRIERKLLQPYTYFYYIIVEDTIVGAIRIVDKKDGSRKRISPLFIMPNYRNRGYAQLAIAEAERIHGMNNWQLATILQEERNCYLYEKMGYHKTGQTKIINDKMTIVLYERD